MNMLSYFKFSTRIIIVLSSIVSAIFIGQAVYSLHQDNEDRLDALRLRAELLATTQADALAGPIWDYDQKRALGNLSGILRDPDVVDAYVIDDGDRVFANISMLPGTPSVSLNDRARNREREIEVRREIYYMTENGQERKVGSITIKISTERVVSAFWADVITSIITALVILLVIIIGLAATIRSFTRPIIRMTSMMRLRLEGNYTNNVETEYLNRHDEIGDIARSLEADQRNRRDEVKLLETTSAIATQLNLDNLLTQIMEASTNLLDAERSTLYLYDPEKNILWSRVAEGIGEMVITLKPGEGLAGSVFESGKPEIVVDARSDQRWKREISEETGFETKNVLSMPIVNKEGVRIGVSQVLNKKTGPFSKRDIQRLNSLNAQASVAIENAQLFENVLKMRNYNESILGSLTNGVISLDDNLEVKKINSAALKIMDLTESSVNGKPCNEVFGLNNPWVTELLEQVRKTGKSKQIMDSLLNLHNGNNIAVNLAITPLETLEETEGGYLTIFEDISEEKRVRGAMSRYVSPRVVDRLLETDGDKLEGVSQKATILFTDIRSFTTISESIGAKETVAMLNEYFSEMVDIIQNNEGILDKFIGDAIMAAYGIPFISAEDANNTINTVYEMSTVLEKLNNRRVSRGDIPINMGMGVNTGEVVVGNIGSSRRMNFTVIGDAVNLAARLESATKQYKTDILISEFTFEQLAAEKQTWFRSADLLKVKGKTRPVRIYEAMKLDDPKREYTELWEQGIKSFQECAWEEASTVFKQFRNGCYSSDKKNSASKVIDGLADIYLERIAIFKRNPPPDNWDGVWVMDSK